MIPLKLARLLMNVFEGSDLAFGRSELTKKITVSGKHEAKCWTEKRPVTEEDWIQHIEGTAAIGIPPINSKSMVKFGAIDVDQYRGLDLSELCREIEKAKIPLVVCRSKSGGPHIYLFVEDWVPAEAMVAKLDMLAGHFGFGTSEIFPKQVTIGQGEHTDFGNWINMPYFNVGKSFRYGIDETGSPIQGIEEFYQYAKSKTLSVDRFHELTITSAGDSPDTYFKEGPPCLNNIFSSSKSFDGQRNILLANIAVYAKKAHPDDWKDKLEEYNRLFPVPLPSGEVEALKKSYGKKDYRYQCSTSPLCDYCNSQLCKTRAHGIGDGDVLPNNRSLTVINTVPPIWYLDVGSGAAGSRRISLSTEELQNPRLFQKRCMEVLKTMPPVPKAQEWNEIVAQLLRHVTEIDMPPELTPMGQMIELLEAFIMDKANTEDTEVLCRGLVFSSPTEYYFRWKDFKDYLDFKRFNLLPQNQIFAALKNNLHGIKDKQRIAGVHVNFWRIPKSVLAENSPEKLSQQPTQDVF